MKTTVVNVCHFASAIALAAALAGCGGPQRIEAVGLAPQGHAIAAYVRQHSSRMLPETNEEICFTSRLAIMCTSSRIREGSLSKLGHSRR